MPVFVAGLPVACPLAGFNAFINTLDEGEEKANTFRVDSGTHGVQ
jgi:hypothetical protein